MSYKKYIQKTFFFFNNNHRNLLFINQKQKKQKLMTQLQTEKGLIKELSEYFRNKPSSFYIGLGLALAGLTFGLKILSQRIHPDAKKVLQLKEVIQKSYELSLKSLETLKIQKEIMTEYGNDKQNQSQIPELNMCYLLITRLKLKQKNKQQQLRNPFLPPFEQGLFISELEPTHRLLYNKFNIFKNHLLVITKQFEAQSNQITQADFRQSILVLKALGGLIFFNSGLQAGSSQPHKHIQIFPLQALDLPILNQIIDFVQKNKKQYNYEQQPIIQFPGFNFIHGLIILKRQQSLSTSKKNMSRAYKNILKQTIHKINAAAYNVLATQQFIMVIARFKQKAFDQIAINSVGFMGSLLFKDQQKLNKYLSLKIKPSSILEDITYPKNYQPSRIIFTSRIHSIKSNERQQQQKANSQEGQSKLGNNSINE